MLLRLARTSCTRVADWRFDMPFEGHECTGPDATGHMANELGQEVLTVHDVRCASVPDVRQRERAVLGVVAGSPSYVLGRHRLHHLVVCFHWPFCSGAYRTTVDDSKMGSLFVRFPPVVENIIPLSDSFMEGGYVLEHARQEKCVPLIRKVPRKPRSCNRAM
jgi:hypothetical protein